MKKTLMKLISCLLTVGIMMTAFCSVAIAADPPESAGSSTSEATGDAPSETTGGSTSETTGSGTPDEPKITTTTTTQTDAQTGETTTTDMVDKEWSGETEAGTVDGQEHGEFTQTTDAGGNLISAEGSASGSETTVTEASEETKEEPVQTENGSGAAAGGIGIETEVPNVTVTLKPDGKEVTASEPAAAWFEEETLNVPDWIRKKDGETAVWITEGSSSEENGTVTNVTVETAGSDTTYTRRITAPDGTVIEEKAVCTRDGEGRITGYHMEQTTTTPSTTESTEPPDNAELHADGGWTTYGYELPEKPTVPEAEKDADGNVICGQIVAELHDETGKVVGYTVVTIENGKAVHFSDPVMGSYVVTETKVETLENGLKQYTTTKTKQTSQSSAASGVTLTGGERTVTAEMGKVTGSTEFDTGSFETYQPGIQNLKDGSVDSNAELYNRPIAHSGQYNEAGQYFQWLGEYGLESLLRVKAGGGNTWKPHQFVLQGKNGGRYYVYCADFEVAPQSGAPYNMERIEDAKYVKPEDADRIRGIVLKGYWGVANSGGSDAPTPGSLDAFRKLLTDANVLSQEEASSLTDGMALTATQAAIWYYGNSGTTMLNPQDIVGRYYLEGNNFQATDPSKAATVNKVYQYLIAMDGTPADAGNTLITKDDFAKQIDLTVKKKQANDRYDTDVRITMAVALDDTTSNLRIYVADNAGEIGVYRLSGTSEESELRATKNPDGSYTLPGLQLRDGTPITLRLNGAQTLTNGVYLFTCENGPDGKPSQTFIGAGKAEQTIDLRVDFQFRVTDPLVMVHTVNSGAKSQTLEWAACCHTSQESAHDDPGKEVEPPEEIEEVVIEQPDLPGGQRNTDVPKTGDSLYLLQLGLAAGIVLCLLTAAVCRIKKDEV